MLRRTTQVLWTGAALGALLGCYTTEFTPAPASPAAYQSTGTITATGNDIGHAIARAREEGAVRGCAAVSLPISAGATEATAVGAPRTTLVVECLVPATPPSQPAACPEIAPVPVVCTPECRPGFDCVHGQCVSACNPPCPEGSECVGHGADALCAPTAANPPETPVEPTANPEPPAAATTAAADAASTP